MAGFRFCAFKNWLIPEMQLRLTSILRLARVTFKLQNSGHYSHQKPVASDVKPATPLKTRCQLTLIFSGQTSVPELNWTTT